MNLPEILNRLESHCGSQKPCWPTEPFQFLVWWHCGYPASDAACQRGWESVKEKIGIESRQILAVSTRELASALKADGMVPELRAVRIKEIAARVQDQFGADLRSGLVGSLKDVRKSLKKFPGIADPGVDRVLLFARYPKRLTCREALQCITGVRRLDHPHKPGGSSPSKYGS
jgi:endonuclease III